MTIFEIDGRLLIIDCGVLFPEDHQPGIDLVLPDFDLVRDRLADVEALVVTHAHEDHIGGVPYLLRERPDLPVVGTRFTLAMVEAKCREHRIKPVERQIAAGQRESFGPFTCEFVTVNHSIPDAVAVAMHTSAGTILHTGDFKLDPTPLDGKTTDLRHLGRLGDAGIDLLLIDSTNAEVAGHTPSERTLAPAIDHAVGSATGLVVTATFSSHVHRVQQLLDAAVRHGRKVALVGRSMIRTMTIARELGYLHVPADTLVDGRHLDGIPRNRLLILSTGSQGEPLSALARMASGNHQSVNLDAGDTVILAAGTVPGNEVAVSRVINGLVARGVHTITRDNANVHVSGHARSGEILVVYDVVRPRQVMPVHGEIRHLAANAALAVSTGVDPRNVLVGGNGVSVDLTAGKATIAGAQICTYLYVDGRGVGEIDEEALKDRLVLGEEGFILVTAVIDTVAGQLVSGPEISSRGFAESASVVEPVGPLLVEALTRALAGGEREPYALQQVIRRVVGRWVADTHRRKPMILPVVVTV
jgi:ribonuclease J